MPWQRGVIRDIYGAIRPEDGVRRYRHAYISVPKQNGKSFLLGGLPLYHLIAETEIQPEVYGCAAAREQAGIIFKATAQLVRANPILLRQLDIIDSTKRIVRKDRGGFYAVLSADGDVQDGIRPSLLLRDEVHRWKTVKAETLYDVTTKGQISRPEPLDLAITTAGAEYESPLWFREYEHAKQVLNGAIPGGSHYVAIWEANARKIEADPEYWKSREARVTANPSHEDHGGFLKDAAIVGELEKALTQPSERSKYLRYHLNVPMRATEDPIIDMSRWQRCDGGVDLREWPEYDFELLIRKWNLIEKPCYVGVDASTNIDLTAVVFIFPPFDEDKMGPGASGKWTFLPFFFMPAERVFETERRCRVPIRTWAEQKFIRATPGQRIDIREALDRIRWGRQMFELRELLYDPMSFRREASDLADEGIKVTEISQTFKGLSYGTKFFLSHYLDSGVRHGNNPVLNWNASCLQLQYDHKDNCQPTKPERDKSSKRIDGCQAIITALSRAIVDNSKKSRLEERGVRFI